MLDEKLNIKDDILKYIEISYVSLFKLYLELNDF